MPESSSRWLTPDERSQLASILGARRRQAWKMTGLTAFAMLVVAVRMFLPRTKSGDLPILVTAFVVFLGLMGAFVWFLGFGLVRQLEADLKDDRAATIEGTIKKILVDKNTYGDVVTTVDVDDTRVLTREGHFSGMKEGQRVRVLIAPQAKVALSVTPLAR